MSGIITFLVAILSFTILVVVHELGHFFLARLTGIGVEEFAIGMGPKVYFRKGIRTDFSIRAFPIGGFCKMRGEDEDSEAPDAFNKKAVWRRFLTIFAGAFLNIILAILLFSFIFSQTIIIGSVISGKAADKAGIQAGDQLVSVAGTPINDYTTLNKILNDNNGKEITIVLKKDGQIIEKSVKPVFDKVANKAIIGVQLKPALTLTGFSVIEGVRTTVDSTSMMLDFLRKLVSGQANKDEVSGPIGIISYYNQAAKLGFAHVLILTAILSLNLAIINLLPLPALDGGRLFFLLIEAIRRKPIPPEKEGFVHFIGFVLLMGLMVLVLYNDIIKLFTGKL